MARDSNLDARFDRGPAGELWRHTVARIPTLYGRLVYLSSLRNQHTGNYEHHGLSQMCGQEEAAQALSQSHAQVFQDWLCLNLEQQKADLDEYLEELPGDTAAVLDTWVSAMPYRTLVPPAAHDVERQLYLTDFAMLLEVLRREYGGASRDRES
jgi:hypothetical protein